MLAAALPGAAVWAGLGLVLGALRPLHGLGLGFAITFAGFFGLAELLSLPIRAPESRWQVPASWLRGRSALRQELTWGALLGPGIITRNPFASLWMLPLLLVGVGGAGAAIGAVGGFSHGAARALGLLENAKRATDPIAHFTLTTRQPRLRVIDGLALLVAFGVLLTLRL